MSDFTDSKCEMEQHKTENYSLNGDMYKDDIKDEFVDDRIHNKTNIQKTTNNTDGSKDVMEYADHDTANDKEDTEENNLNIVENDIGNIKAGIEENKVENVDKGDTEHRDIQLSSSDEFDTDLDDDSDDSKEIEVLRENVDIGHYSYIEACELLKTSPIRMIIDQLKEREIHLQHVGLNTDDVIALSYGLLQNHRVESLDLEDNGLTEEALLHIVEVLRHNTSITSLSISENNPSKGCALALGDVLRETTWLTHLNLSGSRIGDAGAKHIASGIRGNVSLIWLNLSHNEIGEAGAKVIGKSLSINDTLKVFDLSWNHIRRMGAVAICRGLHENKALGNLNMSWNGFGFEGSIALEEALKTNKVLKVLDVSNNRINWDGIVYICKGLKQNTTLQILKIGNNPISMEGCQKLLHTISAPKNSILHVGLEDVPINGKVAEIASVIASNRMFSLTHGGILDTRDVIGIRKEKPIDPLTLLVRYISLMGIRVIDLFRMFDQDYHGQVTKDNFVRGIKKIGAPLRDTDLRTVARRLDRKGTGYISYSILANGVRNHMREERKEDRKMELLELKRREERKRILRTGVADFRAPVITEVNSFRSSATKNFERLLTSSSATSFGGRRESLKQSQGSFLPHVQNDGSMSSRSVLSMSSYKRPISKLSGETLSAYSELNLSATTTDS